MVSAFTSVALQGTREGGDAGFEQLRPLADSKGPRLIHGGVGPLRE